MCMWVFVGTGTDFDSFSSPFEPEVWTEVQEELLHLVIPGVWRTFVGVVAFVQSTPP